MTFMAHNIVIPREFKMYCDIIEMEICDSDENFRVMNMFTLHQNSKTHISSHCFLIEC